MTASRIQRREKPITPERIERALDRLAQIMVDLGPDGPQCLPIYERLEQELAALQVTEYKMAAVRDRLTRSSRRTATPSA